MNKILQTTPGVFIIESLTIKDENANRFEGKIVAEILELSGIRNTYYYVRTQKEFVEILNIFRKSKFRYLHISCHSDGEKLLLTFDEVIYKELGEILFGVITDRRLFMSACSVINKRFIDALSGTDAYSIIGPNKDIYFNDSTIVWASLYHLFFKENETLNLNKTRLKNSLRKVFAAFNISMKYYSRSTKVNGKYILNDFL